MRLFNAQQTRMRIILIALLALLTFLPTAKPQTTTTTIGGQTVNRYSNGYQNYTVPSYGYVTRYYEDGTWRYYVNGSLLDYNYFGSLKTLTSNATFDLGKIGQFGRLETDQKFALIWQTFRESHALSPEGRFVPSNKAATPANKLTLYEFAHYVSEARPAITISSIVKCDRCSGKRMRTGFTATGAVGEVPCEDCNAYGSIAKQENYALIITGPLPQRPKLEDFIKEGLLAAPAAKAPAPIATPPAPVTFPATKKQPEVMAPAPAPAAKEPVIAAKEPTPEDRFRSAKARAEAGDSQAQYELGLFYSQDYERAVAIDYFEAFAWTQKAAQKNHRMAQRLLAKFYELGRGTDKNLEEAVKWYRTSALLGCKQSQRWMGQMYHTTFQGSKIFEEIIKKDTTNLSEAYAWFLLGAEKTFPNRTDSKIPTAEELAFGPALIIRDYNFEVSTQGTCEGERDNVAKNPNFTRAISDSAKARFSSLQLESQEYRQNNKPR
jgi:hypothetical protein